MLIPSMAFTASYTKQSKELCEDQSQPYTVEFRRIQIIATS